MKQMSYRCNWWKISVSDLKLEMDMYRRWLNKVGATDKQTKRLKVMEDIYLKRLNKELSLFNYLTNKGA